MSGRSCESFSLVHTYFAFEHPEDLSTYDWLSGGGDCVVCMS
jgi:hypothetical protein